MPENLENKIKYFYHQEDENGYVHSVDMLTLEYFLSCSVEKAVALVSAVFSEYVTDWKLGLNTKLNCKASSNYDFYNNHLWGMGIRVSVGKWQKFDRDDKQWIVLPALRVIVNPNKCFSFPLWQSGFAPFLQDNTAEGFLQKYDYAIDIPVKIDDVIVHSRKTPGLYNGTRYYGMRNKHGRLKIYDKGKEQKLAVSLTRVEWTEKTCMKRSFDEVSTINGKKADDFNALPTTTRNIVLMLLKIQTLGGSITDDLNRLPFRMRKTVEPYVLGSNTRLHVDDSILDGLLNCYAIDLSVNYNSDCVKVSFGESGFVTSNEPVLDDPDDEQFALPF